jgi:hypothetical protein
MEELRSLGVQESQMPSFLATLDFAETRPLVTWMLTSDDGDLWIQRGGSPAEIAQESGMSQLALILGSPLWDHPLHSSSAVRSNTGASVRNVARRR